MSALLKATQHLLTGKSGTRALPTISHLYPERRPELAQEALRVAHAFYLSPKWLLPFQTHSKLSEDSTETAKALAGSRCEELQRFLNAALTPRDSQQDWQPLPDTRPQTPVSCKLSIVAVSRNDNHGGYLLPRMQAFIDTLLRQSEAYQCPIEIILVEWNPPPQAPRFADCMSFPANSPFASIKVVEVPPAAHQNFEYADALPLYQMIGKNVGVRRATGEYILCTNIDILLEDLLFQFLSESELDPRAIYRCDRQDAVQLTTLEAHQQDLLSYCRSHPVRYNKLDGTYDLQGNLTSRVYSETGDNSHVPHPKLHTNACGDFQLMHRDRWHEIGGYAEIDGYSLHIDSLLQITAHFAGLTEVQLPPPLVSYHIDHHSGWSPETQQDGTFEKSLKKRKLPKLDYAAVIELAHLMNRQGRAFSLNSPAWGLLRADLPSTEVCSRPTHPRERSPTTKGFTPVSYLNPPCSLVLPEIPEPVIDEWREFAAAHLNRIAETVSRLSRQREITLWGASKRGQALLESLRHLATDQPDPAASNAAPVRLPITGFVDSNPSLNDTLVAQLPVEPPKKLDGQSRNTFVLICSIYGDEIECALHSYGYEPLTDYLDPFL